MEQAESASKLESVPRLQGIASRHGALKGTRYPDRRARTPGVADRTVLAGRHRVELTGKAEGDNEIAVRRTSTPALPCLADSVPSKAPAIDYRCATDEQLLAAARSADKDAFTELSNRCAAVVHRKVLAIVRNREDGEDVVQEALFKAYAHLDGFRGSSTFSTWLTKIAINSALMLLRKKRSPHEVSLDQCGEDSQTWAAWEISDPRPDAEQI